MHQNTLVVELKDISRCFMGNIEDKTIRNAVVLLLNEIEKHNQLIES